MHANPIKSDVLKGGDAYDQSNRDSIIGIGGGVFGDGGGEFFQVISCAIVFEEERAYRAEVRRTVGADGADGYIGVLVEGASEVSADHGPVGLQGF